MTEFIARIASKTPYEFYEARAATFAEMVEAEAYLRDHNSQTTATDPVLQTAVANVQQGGLAPALPGLSAAPQQAAPAGLGAPAPKQWNQQAANSGPAEKRELGSLADGTQVAVQKGQYGWYVNAYRSSDKWKLNANLPKGISDAEAAQLDLNGAVEVLQQKMAQG